jgi:hypothetical protein
MIEDFTFENHGTICILTPLTDEAEQWVKSYVDDTGFQPYWPAVVMEPRYADDVLQGIADDGLMVQQ